MENKKLLSINIVNNQNELTLQNIDRKMNITFRNNNIHGSEMIRIITTNISISKPKYWPSKGFYEM